VRLVVVSVGRLRPPYLDDVAHYRTLLSRYVRLEEVEVRAEGSPGQAAEAVRRRLPGRAFVSLLADRGQAYDSDAFSRFLEARRHDGRDLAFVIGGAFGLELGHVDHRLSLGPMTLPHQLARVVLLEQLYRAHKILAGEPYHH
jgi:23S rRNA (pseudouridine1915-N3)-methyltransferase